MYSALTGSRFDFDTNVTGSMQNLKKRVIISVEQALTLTYTTQRCVQLGWRVIRVEPTPIHGLERKGDPNRYIGRRVAGEDRHSYFVSTNVGKEALAIDLKQPEGRELLRHLICELDADVFCNNTLPIRHQQLGIDYESLQGCKPDLIWCCISALGLSYPDVPGYDPVMQALCGYMDLTGHADGPPLLCGIPLVDLRAGDEAFAQILLALMEREQTGSGKKIDISMAQAAISWLHTFLPMLDMGSPPEDLKRSGNQHRQFVPVNAYAASDGYMYVAIGSDVQWKRLTSQPMFASLKQDDLRTNAGRKAQSADLHRRIEEITRRHTTKQLADVFVKAGIAHSRITPIEDVWSLDFVQRHALCTHTPDGRTVRLPPAPVATEYLHRQDNKLSFAPAYAEHTDSILQEAGFSASRIAILREQGVVA